MIGSDIAVGNSPVRKSLVKTVKYRSSLEIERRVTRWRPIMYSVTQASGLISSTKVSENIEQSTESVDAVFFLFSVFFFFFLFFN